MKARKDNPLGMSTTSVAVSAYADYLERRKRNSGVGASIQDFKNKVNIRLDNRTARKSDIRSQMDTESNFAVPMNRDISETGESN